MLEESSKVKQPSKRKNSKLSFNSKRKWVLEEEEQTKKLEIDAEKMWLEAEECRAIIEPLKKLYASTCLILVSYETISTSLIDKLFQKLLLCVVIALVAGSRSLSSLPSLFKSSTSTLFN